jgi:catechol 2,3-dioxygenase-like lactoylglutathione lyase family enzyme
VILGLPGAVYLCLYQHPHKVMNDDHLRISHFGLVVEDLAAAQAELLKNRVKILYGGPVKWPRSHSIYIQDPNGYEIELTDQFGGGLN